MTTISSTYTKAGSTFDDVNEAYADKNSLYGAELTAAVDACYAKMLVDGILLSPITLTLDQTTSSLTVNKDVTSLEEYNSAVTFDTNLCVTRSQEAGWIFVPNSTT